MNSYHPFTMLPELSCTDPPPLLSPPRLTVISIYSTAVALGYIHTTFSTKRLLRLPRLGGLFRKLTLSALLGRLGTSLGVEDVIPPPERTGVVSNEALVVDIMMLGTGPKRKEVVQAPRELVSGVSVDSLEQTHGDPDVDGEDMQVVEDHAP